MSSRSHETGTLDKHDETGTFAELQSQIIPIIDTWSAVNSNSASGDSTVPKRFIKGMTTKQVKDLKTLWKSTSLTTIPAENTDGKTIVNWSDLPKVLQDAYKRKFLSSSTATNPTKFDLFGHKDHKTNDSIAKSELGFGLFEVIGNSDIGTPAVKFVIGDKIIDSREWLLYSFPEDLVEKKMFTKAEMKKFISKLNFKDIDSVINSSQKISDSERIKKIDDVSKDGHLI